MNEEIEQYCKIYTRAASKKEVQNFFSLHFSLEFERNTLRLINGEIDVVNNNSHKGNEDKQDDFLFWPVFVEVYEKEDSGDSEFVDLTAQVLKTLWSGGYPAIAACDFEEILPWGGGKNSPTMPPQKIE